MTSINHLLNKQHKITVISTLLEYVISSGTEHSDRHGDGKIYIVSIKCSFQTGLLWCIDYCFHCQGSLSECDICFNIL